jgi:glucose/arabinose dehydrogenase
VQGTVLDLAVNSNSERGLLGIALHPNFGSNGFVYLFWSESNTGADTNSSTAIDVMGNRVDRFRWTGSSLTFDRQIIRFRAFQQDAGQAPRGNHNGGVLRFGSDGKLYAIVATPAAAARRRTSSTGRSALASRTTSSADRRRMTPTARA